MVLRFLLVDIVELVHSDERELGERKIHTPLVSTMRSTKAPEKAALMAIRYDD